MGVWEIADDVDDEADNNDDDWGTEFEKSEDEKNDFQDWSLENLECCIFSISWIFGWNGERNDFNFSW